MKVFGKDPGEYVSFTKAFLILIAIVGTLRLGLSLLGAPLAHASGLSMSVVVLIAAIYTGIHVPRKAFGSYRHLLPLMVLQSGTAHLIAALAITLAIITGQDNIFTAPELSRGEEGRSWGHVGAHVVVGLVVLPLILWALSSLAMLVSRRMKAATVA